MPRTRPDPERLLLYGVMPVWGLAGIADWWCHRQSDIAYPQNGGVRESLTHSLMLIESAFSIALVMSCEINEVVLALASSGAVLHEMTAHHDLIVAGRSQREITAFELQVHSVLEILPFALVALAGLTAWPRLNGPRSMSFHIRAKRAPLPTGHFLAGAGWIAVAGFGPYAEELWRCRRAAGVDRRGTSNLLCRTTSSRPEQSSTADQEFGH
jgi:hypothetical protein